MLNENTVLPSLHSKH